METRWLEGNTFARGPATQFEIVPENDTIIFQGTRDEASDQILSGKIILNLKESIAGRIKLRLSRKIRHRQKIRAAQEPTPNSLGLVELVYDTSDIADTCLTEGILKLRPGLHEFGFSFNITADSPASLEGPLNTYVIYRLKCTVERGMFSKDLVAKKHIRIHRTHSQDSLALQYPSHTESHWAGKCAYFIQVPCAGIIYGTQIPMEFRISPLKKGVRPIKVRYQLEQKTIVKATDLPIQSGLAVSKREVTSRVCEGSSEVPDIATNEEGWYAFERKLDLPKVLSRVTQSYKEPSLRDIEVKHILQFQLVLSNPEGHQSEIRGELAVVLFFTRQMHIVDNNAVHGQPDNTDAAAATTDIPPDYRSSQLDRLYDGVSRSGYSTPLTRSGPSSRVQSASNLQSLAENSQAERQAEESEDEITEAEHEAHANTLRNRLDEIVNPITGGRSPPRPMGSPPAAREEPSATGQLFDHAEEPASSPLTRQNSPVHIERLNLSRVPSYDTALRTPAPTGGYGAQHGPGDGSHLPTYEDASRQGSISSDSSGIAGPPTPSDVPLTVDSLPEQPGITRSSSQPK